MIEPNYFTPPRVISSQWRTTTMQCWIQKSYCGWGNWVLPTLVLHPLWGFLPQGLSPSFLLFSATFHFSVSGQFPSPYFLSHKFIESDQTKYTLSAHYVPLEMRRLEKLICGWMSFISVCVCGVPVFFYVCVFVCYVSVCLCVFIHVCVCSKDPQKTSALLGLCVWGWHESKCAVDS